MKSVTHDASWLSVLLTIITFTCQLQQKLVSAQPGFLSLDCGAPGPYVQEGTGIAWIPDGAYIAGGSTASVVGDWSSHLKELRYFPDTTRTRYCYTVPTTVGQNYLLRAIFLHGGYDNSPVVKFEVGLDGFDIRGSLDFTARSPYDRVEYIFQGFQENIQFCLFRVSPTDTPFISSLELRPLDNSMYPAVADGAQALMFQYRLNFSPQEGGTVTRYPDDPYDRFWVAPGITYGDRYKAINASSVQGIGYAGDKPPPAVMNTAFTLRASAANEAEPYMTWTGVPTFHNNVFLLNLFFAELEATVAQSRTFDILVNGVVWVPKVNVYANAHSSLYVPIEFSSNSPKIDAYGILNITLARTAGSPLGPYPIVNAMELYSVHNKQPGTLAPDVPTNKKGSSNVMVIVGIAVGALVAVGIVIAMVVVMCCCRKKTEEVNTPHLPQIDEGPAARGSRYTLAQVMAATKQNAKMLGRGGFGPVYYGKLASGREVAVKVSAKGSHQGSKEFINEVELLSRVHHKNLVSLVGYCDEGDNLILLYEYMPKGTVQEHLYRVGEQKKDFFLDWKTRLQIALNSAQGLEYLHVGCNPVIFHRDVKSNNILLNDKLIAKVADFGLSKSTELNDDVTHMSTMVKGTIGYLDPEYYMSNQLTDKSDVYSFGIVLLELICARPPFVPQLPEEQRLLDKWVRPHLQGGTIEEIVDPALAGQYNLDAMWKVADLAMQSVEPKGKHRPTMSTIVHELRAALEIENCSSTSSTRPPSRGSSSAFRFDIPQSSSSVSDPQYFGANTTVQAR